ncbi:rRNA small subunit methyltransferase G [Parasponia andersonii]|uniref:rRNA small subunit methyltransferase G n=1 Tax=Parasponia andersonii TaxID=3476 RepID=A0A2P5AET2_PARAD|nr:rRNA small subunit methyltransferase G [Parasponia andersonii]
MLVRQSVGVPFSFGTFFKHLPALKRTTIFPYRISRRALSTTRILNSSYFETLYPSQRDQIHLYVDVLLQWNQKMNLTAIKEVNEVMERHVEDSLAVIPPIRNSYLSHCSSSCNNLNLVDVGSGAGLPGIVFAIACPGWEVTLMESMKKRCVFLEHVIGHIGLPNVQVVRGRAENLGQNQCFREQFDVAVARAVAEMRILAEYCLPLVRVGGLFVAAKGHDPEMEVTNAERAIETMGASILQVCSVESQSPHGQRTAVVCLKARPTPRKYPRDPGTPAKVPL